MTQEKKMRSLKPILIVGALALSLLASGMAFAERSSGGRGHGGGSYRGGGHRRSYYHGGGHGHGYYRSGVDVVIGGSFWGPPWYYPPYYYYQPYYSPYYPYSYAPVVEVPSEPPVLHRAVTARILTAFRISGSIVLNQRHIIHM